VRPQRARGRAAGGGRPPVQPHRADGQPAALVAEHHRPGRAASERQPDRPRLLRARVVREYPRADRRRQAGRGAGDPRLRAVAGTRAPTGVPRQRHPLQLALVLELGHERGLQQRQPRDRRHALGNGRDLPGAGRVGRRALPLQGRLGVRRHAGGDVRVRRQQVVHLGGPELQRVQDGGAVARDHVPRGAGQRARQRQRLHRLRSEEQGGQEGGGRRRAVHDRHDRPRGPARHLPPRELPRLRPIPQDPERRHRGGPSQRDALPPGEHRLPGRPHDPL